MCSSLVKSLIEIKLLFFIISLLKINISYRNIKKNPGKKPGFLKLFLLGDLVFFEKTGEDVIQIWFPDLLKVIIDTGVGFLDFHKPVEVDWRCNYN